MPAGLEGGTWSPASFVDPNDRFHAYAGRLWLETGAGHAWLLFLQPPDSQSP